MRSGSLIKKLRYGYSFLRKRLVHVNLQVDYACNFRCQICDFWKEGYRDRPRMSLGQIEGIVDKLKSAGPQVVSIGGGEPLMHPDIIPMARAISRDNFSAMICNGWFVTPDIAGQLFSAGMYEISISLDYANPEKHDRQRGVKGAFDRAVKALKTLHEARVRPEQRVHMISVVMDDNIDEIEPLIKLAREIGVTYLVTFYSDNRGNKPPRHSDRDVSAHLMGLKKRYPEFVALRGYLKRFTEAAANGGIYPCQAGRNLLNIDSQGNVTFCIDHLEQPAGNILTDPLEQILAKLDGQRRENTCRGCWTSCRGTIESLMYGGNYAGNLYDLRQMTRDVALVK